MWIIANWKSNKSIAEALDWVAQAGPKIPKSDNMKVVICPPFDALSEVKKAITVANFPLMVGVQNLSPFSEGAYTGEEPAQILNQLVSLAILGHSERRENFSETDEMIAKKVVQAQENNITPLICVQSVETSVPEVCKLVAYEPVFAIGNGHADTPENANQVAGILKEKYGSDVEVLYGGSVTSDNVASFVKQSEISGVLVGKASLDAQEFVNICQAVMEKAE